MTNRFRMSQALHRLLPGKLEVLYRLRGITPATVVMGQLTVVIL
jgi:hypothetical protein